MPKKEMLKSKEKQKDSVPIRNQDDDIEERSVPARLLDGEKRTELYAKYKFLATQRRLVIVTLLVVVALLVVTGLITLAVILTRRPSKGQTEVAVSGGNSSVEDDVLAEDDFLGKLKPLLTDKSGEDLKFPESAPSLALDWLLYKSNFRAYTFDRQVQRFAMAAFYYSTTGRLWKNNAGWLTNDDECTWYQDINNDICVNRTLRVLSLRNNGIKGLFLDEIALLSSLEVLDLQHSDLSGSIPTEVGVLKKLKEFNISYNIDLDGSIPTEIGQCQNLTYLDFGASALTGSIPSEIGQCTKLTGLYLSRNSLDGSVPSEIGALSNLEVLQIGENSVSGTIPEALCIQPGKLYLNSNIICACCS